ncbi:hypothetical protein SH16_03401 [Aeromonas caviae]|nr:hypothetical protein SH16_03401 [Aeromonas caviae]
MRKAAEPKPCRHFIATIKTMNTNALILMN